MNALNEKRENITNDPVTPIPVEHTFFLEDGKRDNSKFNRFYFNFPQDWCTSNNGETIIGIRNIFMLARRRRIKFSLVMRKYLRTEYEKKKVDNPNLEFDYGAYALIDKKYKSKLKLYPVIWMDPEDDIYQFGAKLDQFLKNEFAKFNSRTDLDPEQPRFIQDPNGNANDNDFLVDGFYDYDTKRYICEFTSPCNYNENSEYYVDFSISFDYRQSEDTQPNRKYDFEDVFNIGFEPYQNKAMDILFGVPFHREYKFINVWDRHSCKIYGSFGSQTSNGYVGNTTVVYNPIKYFKLQSTDQQFWIEFYSGRHKDIPVNVPTGESFSIDMQFLTYNKMLNV